MKLLRRAHIFIGMIIAPFVFITAATGVLILASDRFWEMLRWHSWFKWGGIIVGTGLIFMVVSGFILRIREVSRKRTVNKK